MNFLVHFHLSDLVSKQTSLDMTSQIAGAFLADFVRGGIPDYVRKTETPQSIAHHPLPESTTLSDAQTWQSLYWHRRVDSFTDQHDLFKAAKQLLPAQWRRYAPILVDVFFDHCFARQFTCYRQTHHQDEDLLSFSQHCYATLNEHAQTAAHLWPDHALRAKQHMQQNNWLYRYASVEGISQTLNGISRRMKKPIDLASSTTYLNANLADFESLFAEFLPELEAEISHWAWAYISASPYPQ